MAIISIIGTSGAGTSFLVKQLASYYNCPAIFEGEEGTIPSAVLNNVFSGSDPIKRCDWFISRYKKNLETAKKISDAGIDCYVDGGVMTVYATIALEKEKYMGKLLELSRPVDSLDADKNILLIMAEKKLREFVGKRARKDEPIEPTIKRSMGIQNELLKLAEKKGNVIVVDRTNLDFTKEEDLRVVVEKIGL